MKIKMTPNAYGFGMDWILEYEGKEYFLGQDVKVCSRLLGCRPSDVIREIQDITGLSEHESRLIKTNVVANKCLAEIIIDAYGDELNEESNLEPWELSVE